MRPRIRTLKPEMWADEKVGDLSHGARLLFVGLITMADDEGRLRELPAAILGHVFPYDSVSGPKLARWLTEVASAGMIVRYQVAGKCYVAFPHWTDHQRVDRPNDSELPAPPVFDDSSPNGSPNGRRSTHDPIEDQSLSLRAGASGPVLSGPDPVVLSQGETATPRDARKHERRANIRECFAYWQERCGHPDALLTAGRERKIGQRLDEGYPVAKIRLAIDGAARAAFVNDAGKRFDDIELICRSGEKLEDFIGRAALPQGPAGQVVPMRQRSAVLERMDRWKNAPEYQRQGEGA